MVEGGGVAGAAEGRAAVTGVIDVAAVDDHPIVLDGVARWVAAAESGIRVVGTAATVGALLAGQPVPAGAPAPTAAVAASPLRQVRAGLQRPLQAQRPGAVLLGAQSQQP